MSFIERVSAWLRPAHKEGVDGVGVDGGAGPPEAVEMPAEIRAIEAALRTVHDPELGLDLVSLGLVRSIAITGSRTVVRMTLTTRGCPVIPLIVTQVKDAVTALGWEADVELVWDPPWSPADMSPEARAHLRH